MAEISQEEMQEAFYEEWVQVEIKLVAAREQLKETRRETERAVDWAKQETRGMVNIHERIAPGQAVLAPNYTLLKQAEKNVTDYERQEAEAWRAYEHSRGIN